MKWTTSDIDMYLNAKEYVDTVVIPLLPISLSSDIKTTAAMNEYMGLISTGLERQFKGRLILLPSFTYLKSENMERRKERLSDWSSEIRKEMKHIIYFTSDSTWKQIEHELDHTLIWLPSLPLEHVDNDYKEEMINDQLKQIMTIFLDKWQQE